MKANRALPSSISVVKLPVALSGQIRTYTELQQRIHDDLRVQNPEWVQSNGDSPICDMYEHRLAEMIDLFQSRERELVAA
jgi:hypothetical protein